MRSALRIHRTDHALDIVGDEEAVGAGAVEAGGSDERVIRWVQVLGSFGSS